jgi:SpoIID/LytB domain protein
MPLAGTRQLKYNEILGPPVRIGVLQHQQNIRLSTDGSYRVISQSGLDAQITSGDITSHVSAGKAAELQWRLVLKKSFNAADAECVAPGDSSLLPLTTIALGVSFGEEASAVEYWRCSKPFPSPEAAEAVRATLPGSERISLLKEAASPPSGKIVMGGTVSTEAGEWVRFEPINPDSDRMTIHDVIVGLDYHWRHLERQRFRGVIELRIDNRGLLTAISELPVEAYLFSVNSSEMMSVMPEELLKAQTVAARNTMFATMGKHHFAEPFDLCADDHCQCYRGSSRETPDSRRVTLATAGEVLLHNGEICDARYSKMCGGLMESFDSAWNEEPRAYLPAGVDADADQNVYQFFPADTEERAAELIAAKPQCWCNTTVADVPSYLKYTAPYFRWEFRYTREETEKLLERTLGPIGELREIQPVKRGKSGRLEYIKIVASAGEWVIGKEFAIRKSLSPTFLYSSAFIVDHDFSADGKLNGITIRGAGWGHGAGLCQVGATMMAYHDRTYMQILSHYYPQTAVKHLAPGASIARVNEICAHRESRAGERCYEFYNCYAVATCPVYKEQTGIEAFETGEGEFEFRQLNAPGRQATDLAARRIECEFLNFNSERATPKK